jgi:hypothetical protein
MKAVFLLYNVDSGTLTARRKKNGLHSVIFSSLADSNFRLHDINDATCLLYEYVCHLLKKEYF